MMQLLRFLLVGLLNTLIGLFCIYTSMWIFGLDYRVANAVGFAIGCCISFCLNRSWTFRFAGRWWPSALRWLAVVGIAYTLNLLVVMLLHTQFQVPAAIAQLGGVIVYTASAFLGARIFAFPALGATRLEGAI